MEQRKSNRIKRDLREAYMHDPEYNKTTLKFFMRTNNKDEYRHLLNAYEITEEELFSIITEIV